MRNGEKENPKTRILYVGGWGRSGSTLVGQLLGAREGCFSVGEARFLWDRGILENQLCSCGQPFRECPFWDRVGDAFGGWSESLALEMIENARRFQRIHTIPNLVSGGRFGRQKAAFVRYQAQIEHLYEAIAAVADTRVVIDSSKDAPYLALLSTAPALDVRSIHLVRDSRAAAYSWTRTRRRPEITTHAVDMPKLSAYRSAREFLVAHGAHETVRIGVPTATLRYEDFVTSRGDDLDIACQALGWADVASAKAKPKSEDHSLSGNPNRFDRSDVVLKLDDEWVRNMPRRSFAEITLTTAPLLKRYGYPLRRPQQPPRTTL